MIKYIKIVLVILVFFTLYSCSNSSNNPVTPTTPSVPTTGSIYIQSSPSGAAISINGSSVNKTTPDSVTNLSAGIYSVKLSLSGYKDTTYSVTVLAGTQISSSITLTSNVSLSAYGPLKIYETTGTTASQPSGLILKNGNASSISTSSSTSALVDLFYYSNSTSTTYDLRSASLAAGLNRNTYFYAGSSANLNDGVSSPVYNSSSSSWVTKIPDRDTTKYYFIYDQDGHYSKFKVTNYGGGSGPGDPSWVDVTWIYNNTSADLRFK